MTDQSSCELNRRLRAAGVSAQNGMMQVGSLLPLTSLRFFAAAAVVLFHMECAGLTPWAPEPAFATAVSFFFVLSGFVLSYSYEAKKPSLGQFYVSRFARVWPVHAATLVAFLFFFPGLGAWAGEHLELFLPNLFLLHSWHFDSAHAISFNGVSWSISTELFFYAAFPFLIKTRRMASLSLLLFAGTAIVVLFGQVKGVPVSNPDPWHRSWDNIALHFPPMRLFEFTTGIATARFFVRSEKRWDMRFATGAESAVVLVALASVALAQRFAGIGILGLWIGQTASFWAFAAMIYVFAVGRGAISAFLRQRLLVHLGEISFCTYMVHQIVIGFVAGAGDVNIWGLARTQLVVVAVIYFASLVVWRCVEIPSRLKILSVADALRVWVARFSIRRRDEATVSVTA